MTDKDGDIIGRWARNTDPNLDPVTADEVREHALLADPTPPTTGTHRGRWALVAAGVLVAVAVAGVALLQRQDDGSIVKTAPAGRGPSDRDAGAAGGARDGEVSVQLEQIDGVFIEGFEVGLRFERLSGEVIASTLWTDFVKAAGGTDIDDYYDSVLTQPVPAGTVVVRAVVAFGPAGPPAPPDLKGDLPCRLAVDVAPEETVAIEVLLLDGGDACLRRPDGPTTTTSTTTTTTTTTPSSTSSSPTEVPTTTTSPAGPSLNVGYYVDVDLECKAFELSGMWVLVDGDPRSWQPPDERHEGGTFTLDTPTTGTFRGDYAATKVATFRLLPADEEPDCIPIPR